MNLKLMTPERTLFEGDVVWVDGRSPGGEFRVRPNHATWVSPLAPCHIGLLSPEGATNAFAVHDGLIEVHPETVLILADVAEPGGEIDEDRALLAQGKARDRLTGRAPEPEIDADRARRALARAIARLEAAASRR